MLLLAGLGNPGPQYQNHRHNVGFMAADAIFRRHSFSPWSKKFSALVAEGRVGTEKLLLVKPQTFMNLSGQAVGEAMRFYKLQPSDIIVFYDELDLAPGKVRVKRGSGSGGHNGIKSIDAHCGQDYRRVRIGIGHPGDKARVTPHVLGDFAKADHAWLDPLLDAMAENVDLLITGDESGFMNKASLAVQGKAADIEMAGEKPAQKGRSHIRQARPKAPPAELPSSGPMAAMLKKLFGGKE
ncbi:MULTISPECIES: aminoacyl-tRNA hydrolase [Chelativorans]|jgi:PTH1 family peptidyl-tRNA hydrolase|uniref:Peptidyl-tRNA hydrolase n=1 Tax=Chelativorans sp. (strain BNC1) TaxID=266779 RepID=PTH_CHESB|nr:MULTISPECIES: aminoacyl-tRNA hydrolase [Chelativorans]Q11GC5.1 RecName: Full=Peptidyl-tRNA hydrolase; Short=PTH [Chelativorans sp. BNC1]